jgi:hypothetical protein
MTIQNTAASWTPLGSCALVAATLVYLANVAMNRSQTIQEALLAGVYHPLVLIGVPLGLYWLLSSKSPHEPPRSQDEGFPVLEPPPPLPSKPEVTRSHKP